MKHHSVNRHTVPRETLEITRANAEEHRDALEQYIDRLIWWNERLNLVSRNVSRETLWDHIRHSLLANSLECVKESSFVVDAGTGGGLPGIPLAVTNPDKQFLLNDIVSKKTLAVKQMAQRLGLQNVRIDDIPVANLRISDPFLLVSKHTFKLDDLWDMVNRLPWTRIVLYKGSDFEEELVGIDDPLEIECYELSELSPFYKGKALLVINRG